MKRILSGVHVLMAIGLALTLAACSGSDGNLNREREARAAAEAAAEAAAAAQAEAEAAAAQAAADKAAAEEAAAQAAAEQAAAEEALAQAEAEKAALEEQLAGVGKTIPELQADVAAAKAAYEAAAMAKAAADTALEMATATRMTAQTAVIESDAEGLTEAIAALETARAAEAAAEADAMAAAEAATMAMAALDDATAALAAADTGPSAGQLADQATLTAREAFKVLAGLTTIKAGDSLSASNSDGAGAKFKAGSGTTAFKTDADKMAPPITGWESAVMTGTRSGGKASANVYSNVEAPKDELFAVVYDGQTTDITDADADANAANWAKARIAPGATYAGGGTSGDVAGTFDGVAGTFTCTATCPAPADFPTRRSNGSFIAGSLPAGTWEFKADDKDATVKVADTDHLSFGYWLSKSSAGIPTNFRVWYGGSKDVAASAAVTALDEAVTYTGAAAGKYVVKDDIANTATPGYFTATTELMADFRASQIPTTAGADNVAIVSGTISEFMDGDTQPMDDLALTLSGYLSYDTTENTLNVRSDDHLDHDDDAGTAAVASNTVKAKSGGASHGTVGSWEAQFFGSEKNTNLPTGVAGAFQATVGGQAAVVGGFGASK